MAIMYYVNASTCLANKLTKMQHKKSFQSSLGINEASCYMLRDVSNVWCLLYEIRAICKVN